MVFHVLRTVRDGKRRLSTKLLECAQYLRPGIWLLREPRIANHALAARQPASLRDTKSLKSSGVGLTKRTLYRFLFCITPPYIVRVGMEGRSEKLDGRQAGFPVLVLARNGGAILIDHGREEVYRLGSARCANSEVTEIRKRLGRYLDVPALEIMNEGKVERESFIDGQSFVTGSSVARIRAAGILLRQFEELSVNESKPPSVTLWERVTDCARTLPLPESAIRRAGAMAHGAFRQLPLAPAHGDLSGFNILLQAGRPRLIDLADCTWLPVFFDFYFLNHQELLAGRSDLWRYFIVGDGWGGIESAMRNSGAEDIDRAEWLVTSFFLECYLWSGKEGARKLDNSTLRKWWIPVGEGVDLRPA